MKNYVGLAFLMFLSVAVNAQSQSGSASYIGDKFHGLKMASGEIYDSSAMIAAHKTLDFGTKVRVTNTRNGRSVVVTIKDRGPFERTKIIDVSRAAARQLGLMGTTPVTIEVVGAGTATTTVSTPKSGENTEAPKSRSVPNEYENVAPQPKSSVVAVSTTPTPQPKKVSRLNEGKTPTGLFKVDAVVQARSGYSVQVGVFTDFEILLQQVAVMKSKGFKDVYVYIADGKTTKYTICLGKYSSRSQAEAYKKALKKNFGMEGFVVDFEEI
jgi:rare lipoprotein A